MKKLLLLLPLFFVGCDNEAINPKATHVVLCNDDASKGDKAITTFEGQALGAVYMVHKNNGIFLTFETPSKNRVILDLSKNDCGVN